jgi:hypothetical protein
MKDDSHLYLDVEALRRRGWTESLVKRFLGGPDRWGAVAHWLNFTGKREYFLGRVEQAEASPEFQGAFQLSLRRRKVGKAAAAEFAAERAMTAGAVRRWARALSEDDLRRMEIVGRVADIFKDARGRGYRTPHKA